MPLKLRSYKAEKISATVLLAIATSLAMVSAIAHHSNERLNFGSSMVTEGFAIGSLLILMFLMSFPKDMDASLDKADNMTKRKRHAFTAGLIVSIVLAAGAAYIGSMREFKRPHKALLVAIFLASVGSAIAHFLAVSAKPAGYLNAAR